MKHFLRPVYRQLGSYFLLVVAFVAVSSVVRHYQGDIGPFLEQSGVFGAAFFVLLTALFVVFVFPPDIVLLIPLGVILWGPLPAALLLIAGWTLGALAAFSIARRFGLPLVTRIIGTERVAKLTEKVPRTDVFWSIVVLRMVVPVDLLSYALGLWSQVPLRTYLLATMIGVAPFGFFFAFVGALPFWYQLAAFAVAFAGVSYVIVTRMKGN
ncbi:MAG: VTT domain-containing protein [Candidatus Paceibacterota bacterium]